MSNLSTALKLVVRDAQGAAITEMIVGRRRVRMADAPAVRVYGPEPRAFLGSAHVAAGELIADRLLSPVEVQGLIS